MAGGGTAGGGAGRGCIGRGKRHLAGALSLLEQSANGRQRPGFSGAWQRPGCGSPSKAQDHEGGTKRARILWQSAPAPT